MHNTMIEIPVREPFNWQECLWYLDRGFDDCMYRIYPEKVRRAFNYNNQDILADISYTGKAIRIQWLTGEPDDGVIACVREFVTDWFDPTRDLSEFHRLLNARPELAYMTKAYNGLRFTGIPDLFEALVWTITGQQINLAFAYKIKRRFVETYGSFIEFEGEKYRIFPSPEVIAEVSPAALRELQLSNQKSAYILNIAHSFVNGTLSKEALLNLPDLTARLNLLTGIKGVGVWTANYVLMKSLKENSAVPFGDNGLPKALIAHGIITDKNDHTGFANFFKSFAGWEAYLSLYLWRSMSAKSPQ